MEMTGTSSRGLAGLRLADIEFVLGELGGQHVLHEIVSNCKTDAAIVTASASLLKMAEGTASTESTRNVQSVNATCEWRGAEEMSDARRGITTCIGIMLKHACTPDMEKTIWSNTALDYKVRSIAYLWEVKRVEGGTVRNIVMAIAHRLWYSTLDATVLKLNNKKGRSGTATAARVLTKLLKSLCVALGVATVRDAWMTLVTDAQSEMYE